MSTKHDMKTERVFPVDGSTIDLSAALKRRIGELLEEKILDEWARVLRQLGETDQTARAAIRGKSNA